MRDKLILFSMKVLTISNRGVRSNRMRITGKERSDILLHLHH